MDFLADFASFAEREAEKIPLLIMREGTFKLLLRKRAEIKKQSSELFF